VLPDLSEDDISGSPFAPISYSVDPRLGGDQALSRLRLRLGSYNIKLMVDFIPNHVGFDHPWIQHRPSYLIQGSESDLLSQPDSWVRLKGGRIFAHGRDPNYPGWTDTVQLNYFNPELHHAMTAELQSIAERADGVRCDMAMLIEPEVFLQTWGARHITQPPASFWPRAIRSIRKRHPHFLFLAEVYWDYEFTMQQHGFDYAYDKTLYDRVVSRGAVAVRDHLAAPPAYQKKLARFLENHDEPRIAALLNLAEHQAAAVVTFMSPGMRFFHDGQLVGKKVRIPVHLSRGPREKIDQSVAALYDRLLEIVNSEENKNGTWQLLETNPAWPDNPTNTNFITFLIEHNQRILLVTVNFAPYRGQCFVRIPHRNWLNGTVELRDLLSNDRLTRDANDLNESGLFLDCAEWQTHIFSVEGL